VVIAYETGVVVPGQSLGSANASPKE
jgi:hypothetical protein